MSEPTAHQSPAPEPHSETGRKAPAADPILRPGHGGAPASWVDLVAVPVLNRAGLREIARRHATAS